MYCSTNSTRQHVLARTRNFKHIVRFDKIRLFNAANMEQGYKALAIHSPREVTSHGAEANSDG
jgi:hypothetical protein